MRWIIVLFALLVGFSSSAEARRYHSQRIDRQPNGFEFLFGSPQVQPMFRTQPRISWSERVTHDGVSHIMPSSAHIVAHPDGCPHIAFCGCGASVRVFGHPVRELWLASNWYKYPRTSPAPGMVAVRAHHVFVLEADLGGGVWEVYDANSGGHATRIHGRSLAGYTVVNPRA